MQTPRAEIRHPGRRVAPRALRDGWQGPPPTSTQPRRAPIEGQGVQGLQTASGTRVSAPSRMEPCPPVHPFFQRAASCSQDATSLLLLQQLLQQVPAFILVPPQAELQVLQLHGHRHALQAEGPAAPLGQRRFTPSARESPSPRGRRQLGVPNAKDAALPHCEVAPARPALPCPRLL